MTIAATYGHFVSTITRDWEMIPGADFGVRVSTLGVEWRGRKQCGPTLTAWRSR